jgi:hypothetical protein
MGWNPIEWSVAQWTGTLVMQDVVFAAAIPGGPNFEFWGRRTSLAAFGPKLVRFRACLHSLKQRSAGVVLGVDLSHVVTVPCSVDDSEGSLPTFPGYN